MLQMHVIILLSGGGGRLCSCVSQLQRFRNIHQDYLSIKFYYQDKVLYA